MCKLLIAFVAVCLSAMSAHAAELPQEFQGNWGSDDQESKEHPLVITAKPATEESANFGHEQEIISIKAKVAENNMAYVITVRTHDTKKYFIYREAWAIRQIRGHSYLLQDSLGSVPSSKDDHAPSLTIQQKCDEIN